MRISPVYNNQYYKPQRPNVAQNSSKNVGFKNRALTDSVHASFVEFMVRHGAGTTLEHLMPFVKEKNDVLQKIMKLEFGYRLSSALYSQFALTKVDYSDFIDKLRTAIISAGFVDYARMPNDDSREKEFANTYLTDNLASILIVSDILGEDTLVYAASLKRNRFETLLEDVNSYFISASNLKNTLLLQINPTASDEYKGLEKEKTLITEQMHDARFDDFYVVKNRNTEKIQNLLGQIKELKQNFSQESKAKIKEIYKEITDLRREIVQAKPEEYLQLENQLTEIKGKENLLIKKSIKDPQKKIDYFYIHKTMQRYNMMNIGSLDSFLDSHVTEEQASELKSHLKSCIKSLLKLTDDELKLFYDLKIDESPYYIKIFEANENTRKNIKNLLATLGTSSDISGTIENLQQNRATRKLFEEKGYNYDAWAGFDETLDVMPLVDGMCIRKVDKTDIKHALFLGNHVGCCTAIGLGTRAEFAPRYVPNSFVQAIELVDNNGKSVGNTFCYLLADKNALVLDNMEILQPYSKESKYLKKFLIFARQLAERVGVSDVQMYAGIRNRFRLDGYALYEGAQHISILGNSGEQSLYIDSITNMDLIDDCISSDKVYSAYLYRFMRGII